MNDDVVARMFVHSCMVNRLPDGGDAVVIKEHAHHADGRVTPELRVIRNPKRKFWVTKPQFRNHAEKKEYEAVERLDVYNVANAELPRELFRVLNNYYPRGGHVQLRELCNSPYVYGADIDVQVLIKHHYQSEFEKSGVAPKAITTGFFDTETSMDEERLGEVIMASVTHETKVYTGILKRNFFKIDAQGRRVPGDLAELRRLSEEVLKPWNDKFGFTYEYYLGDTAVDVLRWVFAKVHENRTDFLGVWNLNFDIKVVLENCKRAKADPAEILCDPGLDPELRYVRYKEDTREADKVQHFTRRWHWLHCTAATQMYDAMCLYSILRTGAGLETSYSLDDVLQRNGVSDGKLDFADVVDKSAMSSADWHRHMQEKEPYRYIVYNQFDVISLQMMEWKNKDAQNMYLLGEMSHLADYVKQTRRISDKLYFDWLAEGCVIASPGTSMATEHDGLLPPVGGAVLRPERMAECGMRVFSDRPGLRTQVHPMTNDADFKSMYPTFTIAGNISKQTKRHTLVSIAGLPNGAVAALMGHMVSPHENAVQIGREYFGLPGYEEMSRLFVEQSAPTT